MGDGGKNIKKLEFPAGKARALIKKIQKIARENNKEARLVGGAVRNLLMKKPVKDFDIAINFPIVHFIEILNKHKIKFYETGLSHGTITVVENDISIEVTQTRKDIKSDGRRSEVEPVTDWLLDAQRRDFTINAIYLTDANTLFDPCNGLSDLHDKKLTFIGSADDRIQEDYLRILRAFRFFAWMPEFEIPQDDIEALKRHCKKLNLLSLERITDEFSKWLMANNPINSLYLAKKIGLDRFGFGFCFSLVNLEFDIFKNAFLQLDWLARLAAITPVHKKNKIYSKIRFSRHERARFERLMQELTYSEASKLITNHWQKTAYWHASDLSDKMRIYCIRKGFLFPKNKWSSIDAFKKPKFPITGKDLKQAGWSTGPEMGLKLKELEHLWVMNEFKLPENTDFSPNNFIPKMYES